MEQEWKQVSTEPYYLAPDAADIRHLKVVAVYCGKTKACAYHDETPVKMELKWVDQNSSKEKDFNWETTPSPVRSKIQDAILNRRNPWAGCHWRDSFVMAEGNFVIKNENMPIGD